ncbi:MFS transporter [Streptomyces sp. NRRL WC-3742]|uniref:MFS transporter n=1 Tax=Streptomyces sp. NRRL WC-3742 TaxID=1463934 RepID=UPI00055F407E|nr:MFS transporter [Streptomyces sp. NRRL WC-3742]
MSNAQTATAQALGAEPVPPPTRWSPVLALALATFTVVSSEMMPVGLLTPMAHTLGVTDGVTGLSLTVTGLVAAAVSPFAPALIGRHDRRRVLIAFLLLLCAADALSALAPDFAVLAASRVLLGVAMGVVWVVAAALGSRLVQGPRVALATTLIFSGVSIASVLGVPLGTYLAAAVGWRGAFWALALLGALGAAVLAAVLPPLPVAQRGRIGGLAAALRHRGVATGLAVTALVVLGHFTGYTYVRPVLETDAGLAGGVIASCLLVYGLAGVAGNFTLGPLAGRRPRTAVVTALTGVTLAAALLPYGTGSLATVLGVLVVWGVSYGGVSVSTQTWVSAAAPDRFETSVALWSGVFNASIALGSLAGGLVIDRAGNHAVLATAALFTGAGLLLAALSRPSRPQGNV